MTIICYLRRGKKSAIAAADETITLGERAVDNQKKIYTIGPFLFSYSGRLDVGEEIFRQVKTNYRKSDDFTSFLECTKNAYTDQRDKQFMDMALRERGITWEKWEKRDFDDITKNELEQIYTDPRLTNCNILIGGISRGIFDMYRIIFAGKSVLMGDYDSIGGEGSLESQNAANRKIAEKIKRLENGERENLSLAKSAKIVLEAVQEGWLERGVGGVTQIVTVENGKIRDNYTRRQSRFLHNVIALEDQKELDPDYVDSVIEKTLQTDDKKSSRFPRIVHDVITKRNPKVDKRSRNIFFNDLTTTIQMR